jgi:hypothetical protein
METLRDSRNHYPSAAVSRLVSTRFYGFRLNRDRPVGASKRLSKPQVDAIGHRDADTDVVVLSPVRDFRH